MPSEYLTMMKELANFGAAGLMGALWLWERRLSRTRETQLTEAHGRIVAANGPAQVLTDLVRRNTAALTGLKAAQHQLVGLLSNWIGNGQAKADGRRSRR